MKIVRIIEHPVPISSKIRNAYIDFSTMTASVVAVVTDVQRGGKPVIGYGFNSNGRYASSRAFSTQSQLAYSTMRGRTLIRTAFGR
jgi:D(-)-tartrate dehydratase